MYPLNGANLSGYLGEVRQTPDGQLYQLGEAMDELGNYGLAWFPLSGTGLGEISYPAPQLGEIRQAPNGQYYQYTTDGLGNVGFAPLAALLPMAAKLLPAVTSILPGVSSLVSNLFKPSEPAPAPPAYTPVAPAPIPVPYPGALPGQPQAPTLNVNDLLSKLISVLGARRRRRRALAGLGEDPDLLGIGEDPDLIGLAEDLELMGYGEADQEGFGEDPDPLGIGEDLDLMGVGEDDDLRGFAEDPGDFQGLAEDDPGMQGYLTAQGENLQGYVKGYPPANPRYAKRTTQPDMWRPLWD